MKKFLLAAVALTALIPGVASAQTVVKRDSTVRGEAGVVQVPTTDASVAKIQAVVVVNPTTGVATATSDASAANQASQITQETAINTVLGTVTTSPTANTIGDRLKTINTTLGSASTAANQSTLITAVGTTNTRLSSGLQGARPFVIKGSITTGQTSYATNGVVGGLVTIPTGLPAGTVIASSTVRIKAITANTTTLTALYLATLDSAPTTSTVTDNVAINITQADLGKVITLTSTGSWNNFAALGVAYTQLTLPRVTVDGSGNIYIVPVASAAIVFTATNVLSYELDGVY